jgi:tetratricopeptide (TPR) repeat protein
LSDEDLIRVESPRGDEALSHLTVLGAAGRMMGVAFFRSAEQNAELERTSDVRRFDRKHGGVWMVKFVPIMLLASGDADYWEDHGFPSAGENAYPQAARFNSFEGSWERPDAEGLAQIEEVLRALAETSEEEMDRGRWQKRVTSARGEREVVMALPALLGEALPAVRVGSGPSMAQIRTMERALGRLQRVELDREFANAEEAQAYLATLQQNIGPQAEERPKTAAEQAEDLVDEAAEARGRRRLQLVRRALELWPDCADAYLHLAYRERNLEKALPLFEQAVEAARRNMGEAELEQRVGEFWTRPDTRPFMRAKMGLGECLRAMGRAAEAVGQFNEMLRLNPQDNQGARFRLMTCLLDLKRDSEAGMLAEAFPDERSALWRYARALLAFRRQGDTNAARKELEQAFDANYMAAAYLLKKKEMPAGLPASHRPGTEDEAVIIAAEVMKAWEATEGAGHWLAEQRRKRREREERKRKER